jgi:hypothetical protein
LNDYLAFTGVRARLAEVLALGFLFRLEMSWAAHDFPSFPIQSVDIRSPRRENACIHVFLVLCVVCAVAIAAHCVGVRELRLSVAFFALNWTGG